MSEWVKTLNNISPEMAGALMAMFIAVIRVIYDGKETKALRIILESILCGALSLTMSYGIQAMGLNVNWAIFSGGVIGYLGSSTVRMLALTLISRKIKDTPKQ